MRGIFRSDKIWSDQFTPIVKQIVGPHLLCVSSLEEDTQQATDLKILTCGRMHIAARIREYKYIEKYGFEFTIRSDRASGAKTELEKIENGMADWMFYGFKHETDLAIARWMIIDLNSFRLHWGKPQSPQRQALKIKHQDNRDGTEFLAIDVRSFPPQPPIIVASSFQPDE
jgi:hypothetical protein